MTSSLLYKRNIPKFSTFRDVSYYKAFCRPLFLYRLVGEDHSARPGHLCGDEFHSFESIPIFEKSFPAACNHRVDQEYQLIESYSLFHSLPCKSVDFVSENSTIQWVSN